MTNLESSAEERTCKNGSCRFCVAVATIDEEINHLIAKRNDLRSEHNRAHDPIHRLPDELKNQIFEFLLPLHNEWGVISPLERTVMPTYLASICRGWRDIAWSNPFLWSTMHIGLGKSTSDQSKFVHDWIIRSRTLPLTFHIQVLDRSNEGLERSRMVLPPVLDVMSHCSNILQSLFLDMPFPVFGSLHCSNFQWHRLMRLRIFMFPADQIQPLPFLNPTASPKKIVLRHVPFKSLQISWNHLSSATVSWWSLEDITQLFQHASQLNDCHIESLAPGPRGFSIPLIIHHRLKTLSFHYAQDNDATLGLLLSLTLPCLQEFHTNETLHLVSLPALVHRSSCPLRRLTLFQDFEDQITDIDGVQPLPGVTDLVVEGEEPATIILELLLKEYFPDLRHLTLRLETFLVLWNTSTFRLYLDRKRPRSDGPNEGRLHKFLVTDQDSSGFEDMWNSDVGEELNALGISLTEDGFEFI